jgi:hypothetical protein
VDRPPSGLFDPVPVGAKRPTEKIDRHRLAQSFKPDAKLFKDFIVIGFQAHIDLMRRLRLRGGLTADFLLPHKMFCAEVILHQIRPAGQAAAALFRFLLYPRGERL